VIEKVVSEDIIHKSQGIGIGLFMSKKIITQHFSGAIKVNNSDKGADFIIELMS